MKIYATILQIFIKSFIKFNGTSAKTGGEIIQGARLCVSIVVSTRAATFNVPVCARFGLLSCREYPPLPKNKSRLFTYENIILFGGENDRSSESNFEIPPH